MTLADVGAILLVIICGVIVAEIVAQERRQRRLHRQLRSCINELEDLIAVWQYQRDQWHREHP